MEIAHALFERGSARRGGGRRHHARAGDGAARLSRRPPPGRTGRRPALRCRASVVVRRRADRDRRDGTVFDHGLRGDGRHRPHRHRGDLCRGLRLDRTLSVAHEKAPHPGRAVHRGRGGDDAARGLRRAGGVRAVDRVRQARHGSRLLRLDQGQLRVHGARHHRRGTAGAEVLPLPLHRVPDGGGVVVPVDGRGAVDHRRADSAIGRPRARCRSGSGSAW